MARIIELSRRGNMKSLWLPTVILYGWYQHKGWLAIPQSSEGVITLAKRLRTMLTHLVRALSMKDRVPTWARLINQRATLCYQDIGYGEIDWCCPLPFSVEDLAMSEASKAKAPQPPPQRSATVSSTSAGSSSTLALPTDLDLRPYKRFKRSASPAVIKPASIPSTPLPTTAARPLADVVSAEPLAAASSTTVADDLDGAPLTPATDRSGLRDGDLDIFREFPTPELPPLVNVANACTDSDGKIDLLAVLKRADPPEDIEPKQHKQRSRVDLASIGSIFACNMSDSDVDIADSPVRLPSPAPSPHRPSTQAYVRSTGFLTKRGAFLELHCGYRAFTDKLVQHPFLPSAVQGHFTNVPGLGDVVETIQGLRSEDLPAAAASIRPKYSKNSSNGVTRQHHFDGSVTFMFYHHRSCMYFDHRTCIKTLCASVHLSCLTSLMFRAMKCGGGLGGRPPTKRGKNGRSSGGRRAQPPPLL